MLRLPALRLLLLSTLMLTPTPQSWGLELIQSQDWPQWRGPNRDNISDFTGISTNWDTNPPLLEWKLEGVGEGYASVSVVGDRLYTTGNTGSAQCLISVDLKSHQIVWSSPLTDSVPKHDYQGSRCTPTVDGDRIYVVASNGQISCSKAEDGTLIWKKNFQTEWDGKLMSNWGFSESPLIDEDRVLCTPGGANAMIVCLDKMTGKEIWKSGYPDHGEKGAIGAGYSSIMISEGAGVKQYVQLIGRGLIGVRASDGQLLWDYNKIATSVADIPTPIVRGDYVFTSTGYNDGGSALLKLVKKGDGVKAEQKYYKPAKELQNQHGGMVLLEDCIYFGNAHGQGFPVCVEFTTGRVKWGGKIRGAGTGSAAITCVDHHVIFRYQSGELSLIEATPAKYKPKGSFKPEVQIKESWAQPVVSHGKLFLREQNVLMCYSLTAK